MIQKEIVEILCCPKTKQSVSPLSKEEVRDLNRKITQGKIKNRGGKRVKRNIDGALVTEDGKWAYPVRHHIPIMLIEDALPVK